MKASSKKEPQIARISLSLYAADMAAISRLVFALEAAGTRISRTRLLHALPHIVPEAEIFAHAALFHRRREEGRGPKEEEIEIRLSLTLIADDIKKLRHVTNDLAAKHVTAGRTLLFRALLHAAWDVGALGRDLERFSEEFPDPRTKEGRAKKRD